MSEFSQNYAITVTLQPKLFKQSIEQQYDALQEDIKEIKGDSNIMISLVVELTKSYNIHAHGFICARSKIAKRYIHDKFRKRISTGFIYLKPIDNHDVWLKYVTKNIEETRSTIYCRPPVLVDELEVIPSEVYWKTALENSALSSKGVIAPSNEKIKG